MSGMSAARREELSALSSSPHVAGLKQTLRALKQGRAAVVFCADDAQEELRRAVLEAARAAGVSAAHCTMRELGRACGLNVSTAAAALLCKGQGKQGV